MAVEDEPTECVVSLEQLKKMAVLIGRGFLKSGFMELGGGKAEIVKEAELGMCGQQERNGSCGR